MPIVLVLQPAGRSRLDGSLLPAPSDQPSGSYHAAQDKYIDAIVKGAAPSSARRLIVPALGNALDATDRRRCWPCDGVMLTGSASNVHPSHYQRRRAGSLAAAGRRARRHHAAADPRRDPARHSDPGDLPRFPGR
jgi:hypothetical protein